MPDQDPFVVGLQLTGMGMGVVFVALILLSSAVALFQYINQQFIDTKSNQNRASAVSAPTTNNTVVDADGITPELMSIITAAATVSLRKKIRVRRIRYRAMSPESAWSRQGRVSIMASHRMR